MSIYKSGWRPTLGWVCTAALAYGSLLEPAIKLGARMQGFTGDLPTMPGELLLSALFAALGMGAYRTYEKTKQVNNDD